MLLFSMHLVVCLFTAMGLARPADPNSAIFPTAHQAPLAATERRLFQDADYTQVRVEFTGIAGQRVPAYLYLPRNRPGKRPAILLQYGSGGNKKTNYIVAIAQAAVRRGLVVLAIDIPGRGERRLPGDPSLLAQANALRPRLLQTMGDYSRALDYLAVRPEVDPQRMGFVGISWGAITGIPFVAADQRVKAMVSVLGGGGLLALLPGRMGSDFDPIHHIRAIAPRPLLLLNARRDPIVWPFFAEELHRAAGQGSEKIWADTDHIFSGVDRYEFARAVIDFMIKHL